MDFLSGIWISPSISSIPPSGMRFINLKHSINPLIEMDDTISRLEYALKDHDVKSNPYLCHTLAVAISSLREVMELKRTRWKHEEALAGDCPCGCSIVDLIPTIKMYSSDKKSDASHSSDDKTSFHTLLSPHKDI